MEKDFHTQKAAVLVSKKIFMHKRPPFQYQKRFSCTKGRRFGTKKVFHAQKATISVPKKFFMHKRPPFRHQKRFSCTKCRSLRSKKRFSCTKCRSFGIKKDFHAQNAAVSVSKKIFMHKMPQFEEQKRFLYRKDHLLACKRWSSGVLCNETRGLNLT